MKMSDLLRYSANGLLNRVSKRKNSGSPVCLKVTREAVIGGLADNTEYGSDNRLKEFQINKNCTESKSGTGTRVEEVWGVNKNIMIYWDKTPAPKSILCILDCWKEKCNKWNVYLYDNESASKFLFDNFGGEIEKMFHTCALPSMRADFFRVFWAISVGGIYSDVTFVPKCEPYFFDEVKNITLLSFCDGTRIKNSAFFAKKNCAELKLVGYEIIKNISQKKKNNIFEVTGPGAWQDAIGVKETESIAIRDFGKVRRNFLGFSGYPESTRNTENHWSVRQLQMSIYRKI